jgi:putative colanic acid biosynthesis acetyltransferase WcaF
VSVESIRKQIEAHTTIRQKVSTSVDLPLSNECKRILAYGAEEADRLGHKHIGTEHLLLGTLREKDSFATAILTERGVQLEEIRQELARIPHETPLSQAAKTSRPPDALQKLIERLIRLNDDEIARIHARLDELEPAKPEESADPAPPAMEPRGYVTGTGRGPRINLYKVQSPTPFKIKLLRTLWHCFQIPFFAHTPRLLSPLRIFLLRLFGAKIGPHCQVDNGVKIWIPWNLTMGHRSCIGFNSEIYNFAPVEIGDQVVISQHSYLCTSTHNYMHPHFPLVSSPIRIESQAWVAAGVFIAPGVTVGEGAVIGARSVVTRPMPPWTVCAGNPCKPTKPREVKPVVG